VGSPLSGSEIVFVFHRDSIEGSEGKVGMRREGGAAIG